MTQACVESYLRWKKMYEWIFLFEEKVMFCSRILIFVFLMNPQTMKSMTSSQTEYGSYAFDCFSKIFAQLAITCSKLTIETLEQGRKYVQS